jgi:ABC-2 type transport system permease protein
MSNISQAQNMLSSGNLYGILIISSDRNDVDYAITVVLDDSNPVLARSVYNAVEQVIKDVNEKIGRIPIRTETLFLYGPGFDYIHFLVPGVLVLTAMLGCAFQTLTLIWEKSLGTIDRLLVTPVRPSAIILGKTLAGCITGFSQTILILILAKLIFGIAIVSIYLILFIIFLTSFTFTGIGVFVSGICRDPREAIVYNSIILWPMIFLGGVFFPIEMMPVPLQYISHLLPLTYATDALRSIMIKQAPLTMNLVYDVLVLTLYAVTTLVLGSKTLLRMFVR